MAFISLLISLISFSLIAYVLTSSYASYRRLAAFKGPFFASITEFWLFKQSLAQRSHIAQAEALARYGSPARVGPNLLVTTDPDLLRHMSAPKSAWTRGAWYSIFTFEGMPNNVFSEMDEKQHTKLRAKLGPAYSGKGVDNIEPSICQYVEKMLDVLRHEYVRTGTQVDMSRLSQYFTLDVLSQIAFGKAFGFLEANADLYDYIRTSQSQLLIFELLQNHPWVRAILMSPPMAAFLAPKPEDRVGQGRIIGIAHEIVGRRYVAANASKEQKADMLGFFISHGLSQKEAESEAHLQVLAGSDSTSGAFRNTMLATVTTPRVYNALRSEIDAGIANGTISSFGVIRDSEARQLPYLQATIWEGLRMWPPLFGTLPKVAPPQGETFSGIFYPGGTQVAVAFVALTHRKDIFGADADVFRPERWLEADEPTYKKYMDTVELIFGSGRFGCLGKAIGMMELNKVFVELLRHFDWAIADPTKPVQKSYQHAEWIQEGMYMVVTERKK